MFVANFSRRIIAFGMLFLLTAVMTAIHGLTLELAYIFTPFLIILSLLFASSLLLFFANTTWAITINTLAVPVSIYVSVLALAQGVYQEDGSLLASAIWAPIVGGIMFFMTQEEANTQITDSREIRASILSAIVTIIVLVPALGFLTLMPGEFQFWNPIGWMHQVLTFWMLYLIQSTDKQRIERLVSAGCYNFLFQSGYSVMLYISVTLKYGVEEYTGVKIGSTAADLVVPVLLYISVLVIAIGKNSLSSIGIKNWHLVEGYLFLIAMVVAPPSIIEVILAS